MALSSTFLPLLGSSLNSSGGHGGQMSDLDLHLDPDGGGGGGGGGGGDERREVDGQHMALYLMLSFFSVLGVIGNAIAFYIFFGRRHSGTSVIFILALAGTDFTTCLVTVPYTIVFEALQYRLHYDGLCKLYMFFITSTIPYSSFIMAAIALDRYLCICHPFLHVLNVQRAVLVVLGLAVPAFTFGIITGMSYGMFVMVDHLVVNGTHLLGTNISHARAEHPLHHTPFIYSSQLPEALRQLGGEVLQTEVNFVNDSETHRVPIYRLLLHNSECIENNFYFSHEFMLWFRRVYTSCYALSFITVMVLYVFIYKFIFKRRATKASDRKKNYCTTFIFKRRAMKARRRKKNYYTTVFIFKRRAMKARRRKKNYYTTVANTDTHALHAHTHPEAETAMTEMHGSNGAVVSPANANNGDNNTTTAAAATAATTTNINTADATTNTDITTANTNVDATSAAAAAAAAATASSTTISTTNNAATTSSSTTAALAVSASGGGVEGAAKKASIASTNAGSRRGEKPEKKNNNGTTACADSAAERSRLPKRRGSTTRDRTLYANIKTAMMLFVVTLVFIVAFAPAWFMAHQLIPMQLNVFYMYFVYNVANPFIYAFMNQAFREDLKKLLKRS